MSFRLFGLAITLQTLVIVGVALYVGRKFGGSIPILKAA